MIITIPSEIYHLDKCSDAPPSLSNSIAKVMLAKSPLHAFLAHPRLNPDYEGNDESTKFSIGTAAHALLLEGADRMEVVDAKDWRTNAAKEARDNAFLSGKTPVLTHQYDEIQKMVRQAILSIHGSLGIMLQNDGQSEQTIIWQEGDIHCRARLDWLSNDRKIILDYKTTDISSPDAWMRSIGSNGYDVQDAFYKRAVRAEFGIDAQMIFVVQETAAPYACYFIGLTPSWEAVGQAKVSRAMDMWAECMKRGEWPAYERRVMWAEPPAWAMAEAEEKTLIHETWTKEAFLAGSVDGGKYRV